MTNSLPGYDIWKLASPPEALPCRCAHYYEEHEEVDTDDPRGRIVYVCHGDAGCRCDSYDDEPEERDPDWQRDQRT